MAQPGGTGPVGPYPASVADTDEARDEYDRMRRRLLWKMPSGLYVVGSTDGASRRNGMTLNWATQISFEPKWIGISVENTAFTHELIEASAVYSLCLIDREDRAIVRKFTKPVDVNLEAKTLNGFPFVERTTGAPILEQSVAYLDCEVRERLPVGNHTLFVGEVIDSGFLKDEETEVLRMEDTRMNYGG
jgi:flavin reductase (DIM6/NTAB) family NADH-FMN oxidoreductase RutF